MEYVSYLRVSTQRQGQSGLGLEAQRKAVGDFADSRGGAIAAEFVEVESGKRSDRPELAKALREAKRRKATLLIAKLDRLARNAHFILDLLESGVEITVADMPEANRLLLQIMAAVAEQEGLAISERTKAALGAAKARGVKLGWSMPSRQNEQLRACRAGVKVNRCNADAFAAIHRPRIAEMRNQGKTLRAIAEQLNSEGVATRRGGLWYCSTVRDVLARNPSQEISAQSA